MHENSRVDSDFLKINIESFEKPSKNFLRRTQRTKFFDTFNFDKLKSLKEGNNNDYSKSSIKDFSQHFYICGSVRMVGEIQDTLRKLGANSDSIVIET
ncbi:MAG: hypothetical protein Q7S74_03525 [Nanoarchaeota archaeon]|nr:hypothetical protein [Nanoarchaeota archaeon]